MTIFLIIVSLHGGIERVPMDSMEVCQTAQSLFNTATTRTAIAYCIKNTR